MTTDHDHEISYDKMKEAFFSLVTTMVIKLKKKRNKIQSE